MNIVLFIKNNTFNLLLRFSVLSNLSLFSFCLILINFSFINKFFIFSFDFFEIFDLLSFILLLLSLSLFLLLLLLLFVIFDFFSSYFSIILLKNFVFIFKPFFFLDSSSSNNILSLCNFIFSLLFLFAKEIISLYFS